MFSPDIAITKLLSDMDLWSTTAKLAYFEELTAPWEDRVEEALDKKKMFEVV